jgi:hypothetical protein
MGYEFANAKTEEYQKECWNELLRRVKNCSIPVVVKSLPDDEAIEQWWAEGKESDKFWQDAPYRTNGDVVEEIKTALKYFITVWQ